MFAIELIRKFARSAGYQVQKYPVSGFTPAPVFDIVVRLLMSMQGPELRFVQVGANDGTFGDPLRKYIVKWPWRGILIEPQPEVFKKLRENYAAFRERLIFENLAIGHGRSLTLFVGPEGLSGSDYSSTVASARPRTIARQLGTRVENLRELIVPCVTLEELVAKHAFTEIDVLQIDAEGQDYEILKTLDLSKTAPKIIQFEHGHLSAREVDAVVAYLSLHGFKVLYGGHQMDSIALSQRYLSLMD